MNDTTLFTLGDCKFQALFIVRFWFFQAQLLMHSSSVGFFVVLFFLIELLLILFSQPKRTERRDFEM